MGAVFISYRHEDAGGHAVHLHENLRQRFGRDRVFLDVDLKATRTFPRELERVLDRCRILLAVIGPGWLDARDERGARRLDDPDDWVRMEVERGLQRPDLIVVPVLVQGARMPREKELPPSLQPLAQWQAHTVGNASWASDVAKLEEAIAVYVSSVPYLALAVAAAAMWPAHAGYVALLDEQWAERIPLAWAAFFGVVALLTAAAAYRPGRTLPRVAGRAFLGLLLGGLAGGLAGLLRWQLEAAGSKALGLVVGLALVGIVLGATRLAGGTAISGALAGAVVGALAGWLSAQEVFNGLIFPAIGVVLAIGLVDPLRSVIARSSALGTGPLRAVTHP